MCVVIHVVAESVPQWQSGQQNLNGRDSLDQTLCVFWQIKDKELIERDFHSVALVMP